MMLGCWLGTVGVGVLKVGGVGCHFFFLLLWFGFGLGLGSTQIQARLSDHTNPRWENAAGASKTLNNFTLIVYK